MDIKWVNGQYPEDNRIFDSEFEAYEWSDSLFPDFSPSLYSRENVGYATPDEKVVNYLMELIQQWADFIHVHVHIQKDNIKENGEEKYRIWVLYG